MSTQQQGSVLIEVVVGAAIFGVVALAFLGSFSALSMFHERDMLYIKADLLAEEGIEASRLIKDNGWNNLSSISSGNNEYLLLNGSSWSFTTVPEIVDGLFYRTIKVSKVSRDGSSNIVTLGGTVDPNTLLVESDVSWSYRNAASTVTYKTYVTNM